MKRTKLVASLMMCVFCLSFLVVGVWAAVSTVNFNLNAGLKYYPEGVYVELSGQVYRGANEENMEAITYDPRFTLEPITNFNNSAGEPSGNFPLQSWEIGSIPFIPTEKFVKIVVNIKNHSETSIRGIPAITINNSDISTQTNFNVTENSDILLAINSGETVVYELILEVTSDIEITDTLSVSFNFEAVPFVSENGLLYLYLGTYPQTYVGDTMNSVLENEWYPTLTDDDIVSTYTVNTESVGTGTTITYNAYSYTDDNIYVRVPSAIVYASGDQTFNDGTTVTASSTYWFKVEPIKWRVLTENYTSTGNTTPVSYLLSEYLMSANFGYGHYNNNCSRLRTFLQENFNYDANLNSYDNISFTIPTRSDLENSDYNFNSDQDRIANLTDFAMVNYTSKVSGKGSYFTSTSTYSPYMTGVRYDGSLNSNYRDDYYQSQTTTLAIRPAILISL